MTILERLGQKHCRILRKEKKELTRLIDELDKQAENTPLMPNEVAFKQYLNKRLAHMLREDELKWYQRAKVKEILEGDNNTRYFQLVANSKHRKQCIFKLEDD